MLQRILARHPGEPHATWQLDQLRFAAEFDLADALHGEGRTDEAEKLLEAVIQRAPDQAEPRLRLGPMLIVRGALDEATDHASAAAQMAWDDPNLLFRAATQVRYAEPGLARRYLARIEELLAQGRAESRFAFRTDLRNLEGLLAYEDEDFEAALEHFNAAFEAEPDSPGFGADLALLYAELGQHDRALDVVARALEHRPSDDRLLNVQQQITDEAM